MAKRAQVVVAVEVELDEIGHRGDVALVEHERAVEPGGQPEPREKRARLLRDRLDDRSRVLHAREPGDAATELADG